MYRLFLTTSVNPTQYRNLKTKPKNLSRKRSYNLCDQNCTPDSNKED